MPTSVDEQIVTTILSTLLPRQCSFSFDAPATNVRCKKRVFHSLCPSVCCVADQCSITPVSRENSSRSSRTPSSAPRVSVSGMLTTTGTTTVSGADKIPLSFKIVRPPREFHIATWRLHSRCACSRMWMLVETRSQIQAREDPARIQLAPLLLHMHHLCYLAPSTA